MKIDILLLSWNRRQYLGAVWGWMEAHTAWNHIANLIVYDDGSTDGCVEFLQEEIPAFRERHPRVGVDLRLGDFRSPPAIMNHYTATSTAEFFIKLDNDIAVPGGYVEALISAHYAEPRFELIGMEAGQVRLPGRDGVVWDGRYGVEPATNIGGVGLMKVQAFKDRPAIPARVDSRFGFTEWQRRYDLVRGWIDPDILCPQLDRIPYQPWIMLAEEYVANGWSRPWPQYDRKFSRPYWEWTKPKRRGRK